MYMCIYIYIYIYIYRRGRGGRRLAPPLGARPRLRASIA